MSEHETYHMFMQVYPSYTVQKIEDDLSWRILNSLVETWQSEKPTHLLIKQLEYMVRVALKFKEISPRGKKRGGPITESISYSDGALLDELMAQGLLN